MKNNIVPIGNKKMRGYVSALLWYCRLGLDRCDQWEPEEPVFFTSMIPYETLDSLEVDLGADVVYWEGQPLDELGMPPVVSIVSEEKGYRVTFVLISSIRTARTITFQKSPDDYGDELYTLGFVEIEGSRYARPLFRTRSERIEALERYEDSLRESFYEAPYLYYSDPDWDCCTEEQRQRQIEVNAHIEKVEKSWWWCWFLLLANQMNK